MPALHYFYYQKGAIRNEDVGMRVRGNLTSCFGLHSDVEGPPCAYVAQNAEMAFTPFKFASPSLRRCWGCSYSCIYVHICHWFWTKPSHVVGLTEPYKMRRLCGPSAWLSLVFTLFCTVCPMFDVRLPSHRRRISFVLWCANSVLGPSFIDGLDI